MIHRYDRQMTFGVQLREDGGVEFRLWAPQASRVELCLGLGDAEQLIDMPAAPNGWYRHVSYTAAAGSRYRYRIDGDLRVPDPASRFQPDGVHAASEVIDPAAFAWHDDDWRGRSWEDSVLYEVHVGAFSAAGDFDAVRQRLDYLMDLGVTALELMPLAAFPGRRNWGYDGVFLFAPDAGYGRPDDLKRLVQCAHQRGIMVLLDVVYNHFGPEGNYLHRYAREFFTDRHHTPWGEAINFDGSSSRQVRDFYIQNALYWLTEYRFDGLRLDAVHAIADDSRPDILEELGEAVQAGPGAQRQIHLVLENDNNAAHYLRQRPSIGRPVYQAQWNDDFHHAGHVLATAERDGYYADYAWRPAQQLARILAEGFAYQGEPSAFRDGRSRGESTEGLPASAFVNFLQNHDQVGNRALGERITDLAEPAAVRALSAILLLAPSPPLLFMGQEFAASSPFLFFCDFEPGLAESVTEGRRREFAHFERFSDPAAQQAIPDPNASEAFERAVLRWPEIAEATHRDWHQWHRHLLNLRGRRLGPHLLIPGGGQGSAEVIEDHGIRVNWRLGDGSRLLLIANLGDAGLAFGEDLPPVGDALYCEPPGLLIDDQGGMPPWSVLWHLEAVPTESAPVRSPDRSR